MEATDTAQRTEYSIPDRNLSTLLERIEKLNRRCRRIGIPEIQVTSEVDHIAYQYTDGAGSFWWIPETEVKAYDATRPQHTAPTGAVMPWHKVTVDGETPRYDGWTFVAALEPLATDDGVLNLIMTVPGETCPTAYMAPDAVGRCDHCGTNRRRKQTFVVRHKDGTHKAVGRQCIKDFLGHEDPKMLAAWAQILANVGATITAAEDEGWVSDGPTTTSYDLEHFLGWCAGSVRVHGWLSRGRAYNAGGTATVDHVAYLLDPGPFTGPRADKLRAEWKADRAACEPTAEDKATAAAAVTWATDLDLDTLMADNGDGYLANIAAVARAGYVGPKTWGLGGSIIAAHARACEKALREAQKAARPESHHVGTIKARDTHRVRVDRILARDGDYGTTYITKMSAWDETRECYANDLVWFASREHDLEIDGEYVIKATVKKHDVFDGRPQTIVNRAVVVEALATV